MSKNKRTRSARNAWGYFGPPSKLEAPAPLPTTWTDTNAFLVVITAIDSAIDNAIDALW